MTPQLLCYLEESSLPLCCLQGQTIIPDLKKNLLSLGALDTIVCKIAIDVGAMKILHSLMIVMKGRKVGNLYLLEGRTSSDFWDVGMLCPQVLDQNCSGHIEDVLTKIKEAPLGCASFSSLGFLPQLTLT